MTTLWYSASSRTWPPPVSSCVTRLMTTPCRVYLPMGGHHAVGDDQHTGDALPEPGQGGAGLAGVGQPVDGAGREVVAGPQLLGEPGGLVGGVAEDDGLAGVGGAEKVHKAVILALITPAVNIELAHALQGEPPAMAFRL